jgi:tRNA(Met) cytidine acetyltransferase
VSAASSPRHRRCVVLRGAAADVCEAAHRRLSGLSRDAVLWIGRAEDAGAFEAIAPGQVGRALGRAFDAVVLDARAGFHADALGQAHGLVWGGGELVVLRPSRGDAPDPAGREALAAWPFTVDDVTMRFDARVERALDGIAGDPESTARFGSHDVHGTEDQAAAVERIAEAFGSTVPARLALLADRGRGKSSALGLAIRRVLDRGPRRIAITGPAPSAAAEIFRFAAIDDSARVRWVELPELLLAGERFDAIVVDEAAQVPVPLLRRLVATHDRAHLAFATTTHGYEGTGRGFSLRFLAWLSARGIPVERIGLRAPIRWDEGDPLERAVFEALLLDAEIADIDGAGFDADDVRAVVLDREALAGDEARLFELFGLLVHAHHRTTPGDLHRILDAPNLSVHALLSCDRVVAATLVAREGGLPAAMCDAVMHGRERLRAHALPDTLVAHLGHAEAGELSMIRSVRIAVHPGVRRRGLARRLVEHVHAAYAPDLFGTIFGATAELLAFRRALGYEVVRVSASRGSRTGEPAVMMLRPCTADGRDLVAALRAELARELPLQLRLLGADDELPLEPALALALGEGLPEPAAIADRDLEDHVRAYAFGPRTFESAAVAITRFVQTHPERLAVLDAAERAVIEARVLRAEGWLRVTASAGLPDVSLAMRTLRRAIRRLLAPS